MARYINVNELLNNLPDDLPYKASVKRVLIQAPTANVVPKSEVEKIFEGILSLIKAEKFHHINFGDLIYVADIERIFAELKKKCTESEDTK